MLDTFIGWDYEMGRPVTFSIPWEPHNKATIVYCGLSIDVSRIMPIASTTLTVSSCNEACRTAANRYCDCACGGTNHGVAWRQVLTER